MGDTPTRHLDIQQSRILGETPQSQAQSNIHARPKMSSSMDKLEDDRRTIAHKHDGTTEDFEEKLHSPEHSQQKRMLNTAWKGETWFKDRSRRMHDHQSH